MVRMVTRTPIAMPAIAPLESLRWVSEEAWVLEEGDPEPGCEEV